MLMVRDLHNEVGDGAGHADDAGVHGPVRNGESKWGNPLFRPFGGASEAGYRSDNLYKEGADFTVYRTPGTATAGNSMEAIINGSGLSMTVFALLAVIAIFASALWFIFSASDANRKFRWFQMLRTRSKRKQVKSGTLK
jgi:hypothetical protein